MEKEREIVIEVQLSRWAALALIVSAAFVAAGGAALFTAPDAVAGPARTESKMSQIGGVRQFYLETNAYGSVASSRCAPGYHMASMWEIADPSNLQYNASLGQSNSDDGQGPPTAKEAWIRTGYVSDSGTTAGKANCGSWTIHSFYNYGTTVTLPADWTAGGQDLGVWEVGIRECDDWIYVWCIEDL